MPLHPPVQERGRRHPGRGGGAHGVRPHGQRRQVRRIQLAQAARFARGHANQPDQPNDLAQDGGLNGLLHSRRVGMEPT